MNISGSVDPNTFILVGIAAPVAYGMWSQLNRRISVIEDFLAERFGDPNRKFKPKR